MFLYSRIQKNTFKKLCPAVNYSTESYTFSHKSMVLSAVVRCKYSFYFFEKSSTRLVSVSKNTFEHKNTNFFQKWEFLDYFVENTLNRTYGSWYKTRKSMNVAQLWRGWVIFHPYRLFTFTLLRLRETYIFWNSKSHRTLNLQLPLNFGVRFFFPLFTAEVNNELNAWIWSHLNSKSLKMYTAHLSREIECVCSICISLIF